MILGRATNLWLALVAAIIAFTQVVIVTVVPNVDATAVATILGSLGGLLGVVIAFVANQPPTINPGDNVTVVTPPGTPNLTVSVNPPLATPTDGGG